MMPDELIRASPATNPFYQSYYIRRCENIMTCPMREIGSGVEHCPFDWLAVYDGRDEHASLIGRFCGMGKFPFSIIGKEIHNYIKAW